MSERISSRLAMYGRFVDDLTRDVIDCGKFAVSIKNTRIAPQFKEDGYFAFIDLKAKTAAYEIDVTSERYQARTMETIYTASPVELTFPGEDELYVVIKSITAASQKILFARLPYVKKIKKGSLVYGENNFSTTLKEDLEGSVDFAILEDVAGLLPDGVLRIIRSHDMTLRPGHYYPFDTDATLFALTLVESNPAQDPVEGAEIEIEMVNNVPIATTQIGPLSDAAAVITVSLPAPVGKLIIGTDKQIVSYSNARGNCIFYYPSDTPIVKLSLKVTKAGFTAVTNEALITSAQRQAATITLTRA